MSRRPNLGSSRARNRSVAVKVAWITGACTIVGAILGAVLPAVLNSGGSERNDPSAAPLVAPSQSRVPASQSASGTYRATTGPACKERNGARFFTEGYSYSGGWARLPGSAAGSCGNALTHLTIGRSEGANWVFTPGAGATCTFQISIPDSNKITAYRVTYQAWETLPGNHTDEHRIESNMPENQKAHRGGSITITFGPTRTSTMDLQLYDDDADGTLEVAGTVAAVCR